MESMEDELKQNLSYGYFVKILIRVLIGFSNFLANKWFHFNFFINVYNHTWTWNINRNNIYCLWLILQPKFLFREDGDKEQYAELKTMTWWEWTSLISISVLFFFPDLSNFIGDKWGSISNILYYYFRCFKYQERQEQYEVDALLSILSGKYS